MVLSRPVAHQTIGLNVVYPPVITAGEVEYAVPPICDVAVMLLKLIIVSRFFVEDTLRIILREVFLR